MVTLKTIAEAIQHVDDKKENLKKAFDDLQARSSLLSSFALSWSDIDSHFSSIQSSITERFQLLQSLDYGRDSVGSVQEFEANGCSSLQLSSKHQERSGSRAPLGECRVDSVPESSMVRSPTQVVVSNFELPGQNAVEFVAPRQELREFCEKMDGKGLRRYINDHREEREPIRVELPGAFQCAPDPGALVLDAIEEFYVENSGYRGDKDPEVGGVRRVCVLLLEQLIEIGASFSTQVRGRAKKMALGWKGKVKMSGENTLEALGFLHLVAAYGLGSEFDVDELVDYFFVIAKYRQGIKLCRTIGLGNKIHGLVQKLLTNGKELLAIRFIFEFGLSEKFPPVPILKAYLNETKRNAKKLCKEGKNTLKLQNTAAAKEVAAMNQVIKVIKENKLESEYPPEALQNHIVQLEKQIENRKRLLSAPAAKPQQQQQGKRKGKRQQGDNKRPRAGVPLGPTAAPLSIAGATSTISSLQQSHLQPAGLLPAGHYALPGSTPTLAPYVGSSAGLYGLAGASMGIPGTSNPAVSHFYSSESQISSSRLTAYSGYSLPPQYHPSYYPQ
ncbi:hypothetical protein SLEP1_g51077 [Rubroshorea leprosula]|uniref:FRIGIDA-like protein n=1 Tax=Rubroshorea leprosula TaxID=152421 RepID=A0AAV5M251_9ROSI|nr:hypothetical protein SLEP1_g51077 [Rubroshorea leprosula]